MKKTIALICIFLIFSGINLFATGGTEKTEEAPAVIGVKEAPELAQMVKEGKIPPLSERLPKEPYVAKAPEEIGTYGGTWRMAHLGPKDRFQNKRLVGQHLGMWNDEYTKVMPTFAKGWDYSNEGKTITIHLREGLKWSDGVNFTTEDIRFWYENVLKNEELATPQTIYTVAGELFKLEIIDDYNFSLHFVAPNYTFTEHFAGEQCDMIYYPAHYLKQFHPDYTDRKKIDAVMKEKGFDLWKDFWKNMTDIGWWNNPGVPTIDAWIVQNTNDQPLQIFKRNPYFWMVDEEGKQLPYVDEIARTLLPSSEAILLKCLAGEVDYQCRRVSSLKNRTPAVENQEKGDYRVMSRLPGGGNEGGICFNYFQKDDEYKSNLYSKLEFRIALSIALNREEMNEVFDKGLGIPGNGIAGPHTIWFKQENADMYAEYDPDRANKMLDGLGLDKRDSEGYRLRADNGERFRMYLMLHYLPFAQRYEMIKGNFKAIGIEMIIQPVEIALRTERMAAVDFDIASVSNGAGNLGQATYQKAQQIYFAHSINCYFGQRWADYVMSDGKEGVRPPDECYDDIVRLYEMYKKMPSVALAKDRIALEMEAFDIWARNLWFIGTYNVSSLSSFAFVKNNFRNVMEIRYRGHQNTATWFFKKD